MRQQVVTRGALGSSKWLFTDNRRFSTDFNVGLQTTLANGATLVYAVQTTKDRNAKTRWQKVSITRVTTTATITLANHGLKTGDNVIIFDTNYTNHNPEPNFEGSFDVTVLSTSTFSIAVSDTGQASSIGRLISYSVSDHDVIVDEFAATESSQTDPVSAVRLNVSAYTDGDVTLTALQQG